MPPEAPVDRVSLTRSAILQARTILITITGQEKRDLLEQAIEDGQSSKLPIGRVLEDPFGLPPVILCYKLNGQWLNSEARQRYAQSGALQPIIGMHRQIHQAAPRLLSLHRRGDWQSADLVLDELRGISRQMQRHLQALARRSRQLHGQGPVSGRGLGG